MSNFTGLLFYMTDVGKLKGKFGSGPRASTEDSFW